jgi:hypothetical protein
MATMPASPQALEPLEEEPVVFDATHYKNGLNGAFLAVATDGLNLIDKYAGGQEVRRLY